MIAPLLETNSLIRYHINCGHLSFFGYEDTIYCHGSELIQGQILLAPILKPHQEPTLNRYYLHYTIQLLTQLSGNFPPKLILQITYLCLHHFPHQDFSPSPCTSVVWEDESDNNE